jgi:hypothetical protein
MPVLGWTNHHSIVEVDGKWYIFYHDTQRSNGVNHLRNVKQPIELTYNEDGTIQPSTRTSETRLPRERMQVGDGRLRPRCDPPLPRRRHPPTEMGQTPICKGAEQ